MEREGLRCAEERLSGEPPPSGDDGGSDATTGRIAGTWAIAGVGARAFCGGRRNAVGTDCERGGTDARRGLVVAPVVDGGTTPSASTCADVRGCPAVEAVGSGEPNNVRSRAWALSLSRPWMRVSPLATAASNAMRRSSAGAAIHES
jgi:hypothetical protein